MVRSTSKCYSIEVNFLAFIHTFQSKKRGLSVEEKRTRMLELFFEKVRDTLTELETAVTCIFIILICMYATERFLPAEGA